MVSSTNEIKSDTCMSAAIVKGVIEHKDATRYFGSLMSFTFHLEWAIRRKLINKHRKVLKRGQEWYDRCLHALPQGRQVFWDKDKIGEPEGGIDGHTK